MNLVDKIDDWLKFPNALGSESSVGVIIGEVAHTIHVPIPNHVNAALRTLSLRGTMRDIASAIGRNDGHQRRAEIPSFHDVVDAGAASCGISWAEALAVISEYLNEQRQRLGQ